MSATIKSYTRSNSARRALSIIGEAAFQKASELIKKVDGMFTFNLEEAEAVQREAEAAEEAAEKSTTTDPRMFEYVKCLSNHDWYYEHSDDHKAWKKGREERDNLRTLQPVVDPTMEVWNEHAPKDFKRVPETKTTQESKGSVSDYEVHGFTNCPHCGVHLSNGIGLHNDDVNGKKIKHEKYEYACLGCGGEFGPEISKHEPGSELYVPRPVMKESLKLDRRITRVGSNDVWINAHQMWKANPDWMTSSQQDALTAKLYAAAKKGEKIGVTINDRTFHLVQV